MSDMANLNLTNTNSIFIKHYPDKDRYYVSWENQGEYDEELEISMFLTRAELGTLIDFLERSRRELPNE